jgi:hypothetical protein
MIPPGADEIGCSLLVLALGTSWHAWPSVCPTGGVLSWPRGPGGGGLASSHPRCCSWPQFLHSPLGVERRARVWLAEREGGGAWAERVRSGRPGRGRSPVRLRHADHASGSRFKKKALPLCGAGPKTLPRYFSRFAFFSISVGHQAVAVHRSSVYRYVLMLVNQRSVRSTCILRKNRALAPFALY